LALLICGAVGAQEPVSAPLPYSESIPYKPRLFQVKPEKKKKDKEAQPVAAVQPLPEKMPSNGPAVKEDSPITLPISVFDEHGNFVSDLVKEDFKVYIDGPEVPVHSVERRDEPLNVLLVIDTSASSTDLLASTKKLAVAMVDQFRPDDKITVFKFADDLNQLTPLTPDRAILKTAIDKVDSKKTTGGTSLYDITAKLFGEFVPQLPGRTVVLLLTDGVDTTSRRTRYSEALVAAEKTNTTVFPVYLDTFNAVPRLRMPGSNIGLLPWDLQQALTSAHLSVPGSSEAEYALGKLYLNDLIYLSGGRALEAKALLEDKAKVATTIADELRRQYYITFSPVGAAYVGQRKHLKIRVDRPNLAVLARGSYIVGSPPSKISASPN
jgi:VWFA-related protein